MSAAAPPDLTPNDKPKPKGPAPSKVLSDEKIPTLEEVMGHAGKPGEEYVYCSSQSVPRLREEGWRLVPTGETVELNGEVCMVMRRGSPLGIGGGGASLFLDCAVER